MIFVSHATQDLTFTRALKRHLGRLGITCWLAPDEIPGAQNFAEHITRALPQCKLLLLVLSDHSNRSPSVCREVTQAAGLGMRILPLRLEPVCLSPALAHLLADCQTIDAIGRRPIEYVTRIAVAWNQLGFALLDAGTRVHELPPAPRSGSRLAAIIAATVVGTVLVFALGASCATWMNNGSPPSSPLLGHPQGDPVEGSSHPGRSYVADGRASVAEERAVSGELLIMLPENTKLIIKPDDRSLIVTRVRVVPLEGGTVEESDE